MTIVIINNDVKIVNARHNLEEYNRAKAYEEIINLIV